MGGEVETVVGGGDVAGKLSTQAPAFSDSLVFSCCSHLVLLVLAMLQQQHLLILQTCKKTSTNDMVHTMLLYTPKLMLEFLVHADIHFY